MKITLTIQTNQILISLLIIILTLEFSPYLTGTVFLGKKFSRQEIKSELLQQAANTNAITDTVPDRGEGYLSEHMVHPYIGFVHISDSYYNDFGFPMTGPLVGKSDNTINICITGGSVAKQLFQYSGEELVNQLQAHPSFSGKEIKLVALALGGFKQPQQLMAVNYMMSLGAHYDYVINIDGFNEVVLPYSDNLPFSIFPAFPRHWNVYSRKVLDKNATLLLGRQANFKEKQQSAAARFSNSIFRHSNLGLFLWKLSDLKQSRNILETELLLRENLVDSEMEIQTRGPSYFVQDTSIFLGEQAGYWSQCSRQLQALAEHFNFAYLHFLQPNQYHKGSKELTREELEIAYESGDFAYKQAVEIGYPQLVKEGRQLKKERVNFTDLTQLFENEKATVYSDKCCHFNKRGYDAIAIEIVKVITTGN